MSRLTDINLQYQPELSMRHLPDLSNSSFEMPVEVGEYLLANDGHDFLKDADVSLTTPPHSRTLHDTMTISQLTPGPPPPSLLHDPLTLSDLTPKPTLREAASSPRLAPSAQLALKPKPRTKLDNVLNRDENSAVQNLCFKIRDPGRERVDVKQKPAALNRTQSSQPYANLKLKVGKLGKNAGQPTNAEPSKESVQSQASEAVMMPKRRLRIRDKANPKSKPTVAAGGITKLAKKTAPNATISIQTGLSCKSPDRASGDILMGLSRNDVEADLSVSFVDGVAQRLVDYGQKFIVSSGHLKAEGLQDLQGNGGPSSSISPPLPLEKPALSSVPRNDDPFTLSQISPRKVAFPIVNPDPIPAFQMRSSRKRLVIDGAPPEQHKRGKSDESSLPTAAPQPTFRQNVVPSTSKFTLRKARTVGRQAQTLKGKGKQVSTLSTLSGSTSESFCHPKPNVRSVGRIAAIDLARSATGKHQNVEKPVLASRSTNSTKSVEFNFSSDSRMEAGKGEVEKTLPNRHHAKPIPDFKVLHAVEEAMSLSRKAHITPVLPITHHGFNTDIRAKERQKFDEMMREKEMEAERRMEERRRQQEIEEEREIRELRKKAVPRANEVPHWYAGLSKKIQEQR